MSRVGKSPVALPGGVNVTSSGSKIDVTGPKGNLSRDLLPGVDVKVEDGQILISRKNDEKIARSNHGLMRALINNMINGVSNGFEQKLEINGVGYRAQMQGADLKLNLGFSHDVIYKVVPGVTVSIDQNIITISGIDKQQVGQVAAEIRALKKPEPYKGKGIKYVEEQILRKSGKSGKEAA